MEIGKVRSSKLLKVMPTFSGIIDLSKIDSNIKIPRFKKGGILSKFRRV